MKSYGLLIATACMSLATSAWSQTAQPEPPKKEAPTYALYPSSKLIGLNLKNNSDKGLGEIGDLLIDPRSGEIRFAVLEVGGFLGVGEDRRVVPWSLVEVFQDEKDLDKCHGRTTLTEDQVKSAPKVKKDQLVDADLDKRIEATFGKNDDWAYHGKGEPMFALLSQLDGVTLRDPADKEVGKIQDLILAPLNGCVAYAVIDTTKDAGDKDVVLPWARLSYSYDAEKKLKASTPVEISKFAMAPEYDKKDWKRMSSAAWITEMSTYYGCDPFWKTTRFASARKSKS